MHNEEHSKKVDDFIIDNIESSDFDSVKIESLGYGNFKATASLLLTTRLIVLFKKHNIKNKLTSILNFKGVLLFQIPDDFDFKT